MNIIVHVDIIDGKIWIQRDFAEPSVSDYLLELGVPRSDIVLGFQPPYKVYRVCSWLNEEGTQMSEKIKQSTVIGAAGATATAVTAASTAWAVIGGSAATIMSATAGTTGAALASAAGASGLAGGAAISSGMATVGSVIGGGMAAGAIITATAPVAVTAVIGYGLFKFFED